MENGGIDSVAMAFGLAGGTYRRGLLRWSFNLHGYMDNAKASKCGTGNSIATHAFFIYKPQQNNNFLVRVAQG